MNLHNEIVYVPPGHLIIERAAPPVALGLKVTCFPRCLKGNKAGFGVMDIAKLADSMDQKLNPTATEALNLLRSLRDSLLETQDEKESYAATLEQLP